MIFFFQERNGDFLAIDTSTNHYYLDHFGHDHFEGRATAIPGLVGSVCTSGFPGISSRRSASGWQGRKFLWTGARPSGCKGLPASGFLNGFRPGVQER
jgi:hypothetical protein